MRSLINSLFTIRTAGIAATALIASSFVAQAADLQRPMYTKAPAYVEQTYNWSGFYAGVVAGGFWGTSQLVGAAGAGSAEFDTSGFQIGGTAGYNWQMGRIVYGIEGDLSYSSNSGTIGAVEVKEDYATTIRGRIGYTFSERTLVYATGGYAGANVTATGAGTSVEKWRNGWTLGAGVEYALMPRWTVKGEYLYVSYMDDVNGLVAPVTNVKLDESILRVGLNYKF